MTMVGGVAEVRLPAFVPEETPPPSTGEESPPALGKNDGGGETAVATAAA